MARYTGPVCKQCRREKAKLFLKGARCTSAKCSFERHAYPPGQHGLDRRFKQSDYCVQLREKQKIRRQYGMLEKQFRLTYEKASRERGVTSENMLIRLESRLDSIVFRLGMAPSRAAARQLVTHGHFQVNNRRVNIPSYTIKIGDHIQVCEKSRRIERIHQSMRRVREDRMMPYLELDKAKMKGIYLSRPTRDQIPVEANEQLVVELYSR